MNAGRLFKITVSVSLIAVVSVGLLSLMVPYSRISREYWPEGHSDALNNPVTVVSHDATGLTLAGGRRVTVSGYKSLTGAESLIEATKERGVEITPDGKIFGLLKIWHWCGNDSVRYHYARVNLSELIRYFDKGEPVEKTTAPASTIPSRKFEYTDEGWSISEWMHFRGWSAERDPANR